MLSQWRETCLKAHMGEVVTNEEMRGTWCILSAFSSNLDTKIQKFLPTMMGKYNCEGGVSQESQLRGGANPYGGDFFSRGGELTPLDTMDYGILKSAIWFFLCCRYKFWKEGG